MSAAGYMDFVAAQCLVSISNRAAGPEHGGGAPDSERLRRPEREMVTKEHGEPGDTWKDYCTLVTIAKSLLDLNKYRPIQTPSVCSDSLESPDEDMGSDSDVTTESGSSPSHSPEERQEPGGAPSPLSLLHPGVAAKGKHACEKRHKCPYSGCGKVYGKSSHLKAHYRVHTESSHSDVESDMTPEPELGWHSVLSAFSFSVSWSLKEMPFLVVVLCFVQSAPNCHLCGHFKVTVHCDL